MAHGKTIQIYRTTTPNSAPTGLAQGELAIEMASSPPKLWCGVPTTIDASGRILLNGGAGYEVGATAPSPANQGDLWYDINAPATLKIYNGTAWVAVGDGQWLPVNNPAYTGTLNGVMHLDNNELRLSLAGGSSTTSLYSNSNGIYKFLLLNGLGIGPGPTLTLTDRNCMGIQFNSNYPAVGNAEFTTTVSFYAETTPNTAVLGDAYSPHLFMTFTQSGRTITPANNIYSVSFSDRVYFQRTSQFIGTAIFDVPFRLSTSTVAPASSSEGWLYYNTATKTVEVYNGTAWVPVGGAGGAAPSATPPVAPTAGMLWWDSIGAQLYVWSGAQWVIAVNSGAGGGSSSVGGIAPTAPVAGDFWFDTTAGQLKVYNGSAWVLAAGGGPFLPVNNPTYTGLLTTPNTGAVIRSPVSGFGSTASTSWEWGPANGEYAQLWAGPDSDQVSSPQAYAFSIKQGSRTSGANNIFTGAGTSQIWLTGDHIDFFAHSGPVGTNLPNATYQVPAFWIRPTMAYSNAEGNWETEIGVMNGAQGPNALTTLYLQADANPMLKYAQWTLVNAGSTKAGVTQTGLEYWARHAAVMRVGGVPSGWNISNDTLPPSPIRFKIANPADPPNPATIMTITQNGLSVPYPYSLNFGVEAQQIDPWWSPFNIYGISGRDWDSCMTIDNDHPTGFASYYLMAEQSTVVQPPGGTGAVTRWSQPNTGAMLGATDLQPSNNQITNVQSHSFSFFHPQAVTPFYYEHPPALWISRDGLWIPSWIDSGIAAPQGIWIGGTGGNVTMGGWSDQPGWSALMALEVTSPIGGARYDLTCDNGVCSLAIVSSGTGGNRATLNTTVSGGLWIQNWQASPAGGIHFTIGNEDSGEIFEQIDIDEHGFHMPNTWRNDDGVTLDDSGQAGLDIPAGGEIMLGTGAGLLVLTVTSAPQITGLFLLGNQFARLISDTSGDGWADGLPPAPQGKLLVFCRDGKYFVSNGRTAAVHLNDMMFKNAAEN